jgi:tRNA pseudouridine-54 N-methylase
MTGDDREVIDAVLVELRSRLVPDFEDLAVRIVRAVDAVRQEQRERVLPSIY